MKAFILLAILLAHASSSSSRHLYLVECNCREAVSLQTPNAVQNRSLVCSHLSCSSSQSEEKVCLWDCRAETLAGNNIIKDSKWAINNIKSISSSFDSIIFQKKETFPNSENMGKDCSCRTFQGNEKQENDLIELKFSNFYDESLQDDETTPDWSDLCASLCKTGDGGSLCNCDLTPFDH